MNRVTILSSKHKTWCYRQGFYQYTHKVKKDQYAPLICKFNDMPVANEEFARSNGAEWDKNEKKWVIIKELKE